MPKNRGEAGISGGNVFINVHDLTKISGSARIYVPDKATRQFIVEPTQIYQQYLQGGKYVQYTFLHSLVGGLPSFHYELYTDGGGGEKLSQSGEVPA